MDWANEDYVRLYTRETSDDLMLSWTALALWRAMLCKFDRSGLIDTRRGHRGLAALVRMPPEVVEPALQELLDDGRVQAKSIGYFAPNFMTAQTATKSDKQRQKESRERRAASAREMPNVTERDSYVTIRDQTSRAVTTGHEQSQPVTLTSADPLLSSGRELPPRAILPTTKYDPDSADDRRQLADSVYARVSDARVRIAQELGLPEQLPFPPITPAARHQGYLDLLSRIREEGSAAPAVCDRVVQALIDGATETGVEWLSLKAFSTGAWTTARERVPGQARRQRASPRARDPTTGRVEPLPPEAYPTGDIPL